jgi:type VI secretion system lysozyme-like protein
MAYQDLLSVLTSDVDLVQKKDSFAEITMSIRDHLLKLFNTRRGSLPHLPDYGLPDISDIYRDFPGSIRALRRSIQETTKKYEPRLSDVRVLVENEDQMKLAEEQIKRTSPDKTVDRIFHVSYLIRATINHYQQEVPIEFHTNINPKGYIEVA